MVITAQCSPVGHDLPWHRVDGSGGGGGGVSASQRVAPLGSCTQCDPDGQLHDGATPLSDTH